MGGKVLTRKVKCIMGEAPLPNTSELTRKIIIKHQDDIRKVHMKQPSVATLNKWMIDGTAKATDGCLVEPDGICPHGCRSWFLVLGYI